MLAWLGVVSKTTMTHNIDKFTVEVVIEIAVALMKKEKTMLFMIYCTAIGINVHECPDGQRLEFRLHLFRSKQRNQEHGSKEDTNIPVNK